ncbi:MAG: SRPBCC family protein [Thermodesulfobacteriota bacterium]
MEKFEAARVVREYARELDASRERVFPLLCPVREYEWIEPWRCDLVYTESGVAEAGCVFRTDFPDDPGPEVWVVSRYEPDERIEFVRVGEHCAVKMEIGLADLPGGRTRLLCRHEFTGLDPAGNAWLAQYGEEAYAQDMTQLLDMLAHFLGAGRMLPLAGAAGPEGSAR